LSKKQQNNFNNYSLDPNLSQLNAFEESSPVLNLFDELPLYHNQHKKICCLKLSRQKKSKSKNWDNEIIYDKQSNVFQWKITNVERVVKIPELTHSEWMKLIEIYMRANLYFKLKRNSSLFLFVICFCCKFHFTHIDRVWSTANRKKNNMKYFFK
jgi:hypothetical protein